MGFLFCSGIAKLTTILWGATMLSVDGERAQNQPLKLPERHRSKLLARVAIDRHGAFGPARWLRLSMLLRKLR
jgi:hypothetical protein